MKPPVGRVYVLSNKAMPGLLKIGYTMNTVEGRVKELSIATGVPTDFVIEYQVECRDPVEVEALAHAAFDQHRYNKSREFFSISLEQAVEVIREKASEILDEEFSNPIGIPKNRLSSLEDHRAERDSIQDWHEVGNLYWKVRISRSSFKRDQSTVTLWQMLSVHDNKKMKEYQSVVSRRRYNIRENNFEPIYDCYYSLPMCKGSVVDEIFRTEKKYFPVKPGSPAESIISAVKFWP